MNSLLVMCTATVALAVGLAASPSPAQEKGRYKIEGDNCLWVSTDSGPNQCTPVTRGRFKKGANDACTWDGNDVGADQCKPTKGRWKKGNGDDCTWDSNDSGPNQCNPRRARARK